MNQTLRVGRISELAYAKRCIELGLEVLEPVGVERYDLGVVLHGRFHRVQVKTGRLRCGAIYFNTCSNAEGVGRPVSYDGAADVIGIYAPALDECYWVPVSECPRNNGRLRVERPRNNQTTGISWAADRALERVVSGAA